jgi:dihydroxyacetone kinase-like protein
MLTGYDVVAWFTRYHERVRQTVQLLTDLDRQAGDGDFGWNLGGALDRSATAVGALGQPAPGTVFAAVADGFLDTGGTSGPLFGLWFGHLSRTDQELLCVSELHRLVASATDAVRRLGGAEVGHKTMVDSMVPAADALGQAPADATTAEALAAAARAASAGAAGTAALVAGRGRASYVGERARGVVDPGALAVAWFFEAAVAEVAQ